MSPDQECASDDSTYFEQVARTIIVSLIIKAWPLTALILNYRR